MQPLNKGQWQVAASVGGPVLEKESKPNVIPLSSVSVAYGFSQNLTAYAGIHPSTATYGIYQLDAGYSHELITPFYVQPGITYSIALNGFLDRADSETKVYPQIDLNAYWLLPFRNDFVYVGISNWFELASKKAHEQTQDRRWIPGLHTGYTLQFDNWGLNTELKYLAPNANNQNLLVDYYSPTNHGSLGIYLSLSRKF